MWRVYVFAQDVNLTKPGTPPEIAAQHIGGFFVASAIEITFDPTLPCPLERKPASPWSDASPRRAGQPACAGCPFFFAGQRP